MLNAHSKETVSTSKELEELKALSEPLVEYLRKYYDLHCQIIINADFVKITRDEIGTPTDYED